MIGSLLLVWIPVFFAVAFAGLLVLLFTKAGFLVRRHWLFFFFCVSLLPPVLFSGSFLGLLVSLQINRFFFDYELLPQGVVVWFGDGPAPTGELKPYWATVKAVLWSLYPLFVVGGAMLRAKIIRKSGL